MVAAVGKGVDHVQIGGEVFGHVLLAPQRPVRIRSRAQLTTADKSSP
ncbi:hypothetical protein [Pseudarthrobacter sp. NBSH8]